MRVRRTLFLLSLAATLSSQVAIDSRPRRAERVREYDVIHYRIQLRLDEQSRSFDGETRITFRPLRNNFRTLVLDAETFRVKAAGNFKFEQTPGRLAVHLDRDYRAGETVDVTVSYRAEHVAIDPEKYGMNKGYGLGLTFKDETPGHPRLIHTMSFPEGARHWFPCYDHPGDKATSEVIATVDARYQVISNGVLQNVSEDRPRREKTFHWVQNQPHSTYLFMLAAGPYVKVVDTKGPLPIAYWVYPKDVPDAQRTFGRTREIVNFFSQELGYAYPWPKYDQISIPDFGGGAESTNATVIGDSALHDARADQDFPTHWLVAHEAAHQWWGDLLTMRDWKDTWLNESFATFYEYVYMKHLMGPDEGALNLLGKKRAYLAEAHEKYMRPIVFDRWEWPNQNFDRHTYQKGGVVLAMLRGVLGEDAFKRSITHYLKKHAFGSVVTGDLQTAIREAAGQNVDWFFDQWVFRAGHPVLDVTYAWDSGQVKMKVVQKQSGAPFALPVSIAITTQAGKQVHRVWVRNREELFTFPANGKPLLVHFDDDELLLKELTFPKSPDDLIYQLANDNAIGRMDAAAALKPLAADPKVASALRTSAASDPFWAVRRDALFPTDTAFLKLRAADRSSAVRAMALRVMGDLRDTSLARFFEERFHHDDSYVAQAEAVRALGKLGGSSKVLQEAERMPSPRDIVANAAREALKP